MKSILSNSPQMASTTGPNSPAVNYHGNGDLYIVYSQGAVDLPEQKARELIIDVIGNAYRRAFAMRFSARYAYKDDLSSVLASIRDCRSFIQKNFIRVQATLSPCDAGSIFDMLGQAAVMEDAIQHIDPAEPEELTNKKFVTMEVSRFKFLISMAKLAERHDIRLRRLPMAAGSLIGIPEAERGEVELDSVELEAALSAYLALPVH